MDTPIDLEMLIAMTNNSEKPQDYIHQSRDPRTKIGPELKNLGPEDPDHDQHNFENVVVRRSLHQRMRYELELGRTTGK